jgi:hypothetical protein
MVMTATEQKVKLYFQVDAPAKIYISDNFVSINGNCSATGFGEAWKKFKQLPFNFHKVSGRFTITVDCIGLTSLAGCPEDVGTFVCAAKQLKSLIGGPKICRGDYIISELINLTSLDGLPTPDNMMRGALYVILNKQLPILRLFTYKFTALYYWEEKEIHRIISKYVNMPVKKAILACQKDLIEHGYIANAGW